MDRSVLVDRETSLNDPQMGERVERKKEEEEKELDTVVILVGGGRQLTPRTTIMATDRGNLTPNPFFFPLTIGFFFSSPLSLSSCSFPLSYQKLFFFIMAAFPPLPPPPPSSKCQTIAQISLSKSDLLYRSRGNMVMEMKMRGKRIDFFVFFFFFFLSCQFGYMFLSRK